MSLTIELSPEIEAKINWNAKREGVSPCVLARRLIENAPLLMAPRYSPRLCGRFACSGGGDDWNPLNLYAGCAFYAYRMANGAAFVVKP